MIEHNAISYEGKVIDSTTAGSQFENTLEEIPATLMTYAAKNKGKENAIKREEWLFGYPAQSVIMIDQIFWTKVVETATKGLSTNPKALTDCLEFTRCLYDYDLHKVHNICICQKVECNYEYVKEFGEESENSKLPPEQVKELQNMLLEERINNIIKLNLSVPEHFF